MYKKILIPLDGSDFAEAAMPLALTLSRSTGAELRLITVLEPVTSFVYEGWESAAVEWSEAYLEGAVERTKGRAGGAVSSAVLTGHTVERIHEEARSFGADLIVMASHGRGALSRLWLGSVADGVVRGAQRPVLLVRPDEDSGPPKDVEYGFRTLLVPLDGSPLSESALAHAVEFGELFDCAYHLARVVSYPFDVTSPYLPHTAQMNQKVVEDAKNHAAEYLEAKAEEMRRRGLQVTTSVAVDPQPGHGVLQEGEAVGADVIAMSTHGHTGLRRAVLGSAADKVMRGTHKPLLLFRPKDEAGQ